MVKIKINKLYSHYENIMVTIETPDGENLDIFLDPSIIEGMIIDSVVVTKRTRDWLVPEEQKESYRKKGNLIIG